jgi:hypothetical protein
MFLYLVFAAIALFGATASFVCIEDAMRFHR